jgi:hypothetical protein
MPAKKKTVTPKRRRATNATPKKTSTRSRKTTARKAKKPASGAPRRASAASSPTLALPDVILPLPGKVDRQQLAMRWSYIVRERQRWAGGTALTRRQAEQAEATLGELGLREPECERIADAGVAQVVVPYRREEQGWEARVMPWEYLLSAGTWRSRGERRLTVLRKLEHIDDPEPGPASAPKSVLFVQSAPGSLADLYDFRSEIDVVTSNLGLTALAPLKNPTRDELTAAVRKHKPDVIHLAGFDSHQAVELDQAAQGADTPRVATDKSDDEREAPEPSRPARVPTLDGFALASEARGHRVDLVSAQDLSTLLTAGGHRPLFVACNFWNSGARCAALAVGAGARAAIGFQDSFDDDVGELFYAAFYRGWRQRAWQLRGGFEEAWNLLRADDGALRGTGVILWSDSTLVGPHARAPKAAPRVDAKKHAIVEPLLQPQSLTAEDVARHVRVEVKPLPELNYSLLQNNRPLFETFKLVPRQAGRMAGIEVSVFLSAGEASSTYRYTFDLGAVPVLLTNKVHVSLAPALVRTVHEAVTTSLLVEVTWGNHVLHRDSYRVRLLPVDQWRDTDDDRRWLPSFVFPRDPAVTEAIASAYRYVRTLRDDPAAGFDGYQSIDDTADDPTQSVDLQVQAIWSAILHEWHLGYTNPPPAQSSGQDSQRLRTPSSVRGSNTGTCIDLALLLAGCLELVDIYPVLFLFQDHACPGYWRSAEYQATFLDMSEELASRTDTSRARESGPAGSDVREWEFNESAYAEILREIRDERLVPLESVRLTENAGFWEAVEAGTANFRRKSDFCVMIDVAAARTHLVTPLPLREEAR